MSRYIDAEKIKFEPIDIVVKGITRRTIERMATETEIDAIPTADVEEVRYGKWVAITVPRHDPHGEKFWFCTNCERAWRLEGFPKRCPECGAKMNKWCWCDNQQLDENHEVICLAHLAEGRALKCPYKDAAERETAEYPCSDYEPKADVSVEEVRHGEWIPIEQRTHWADTETISTNIIGFRCSLCGAEEKFKYKYCHCGCKMGVEKA